MAESQGFGLDELVVGQSAEIQRLVDDDAVRRFAEVSGDFNPLHMDEDYARKTAFRGRIAHGALIASYISCVLGSHLPGPGAVFAGMTMRFARPVRIGDLVTARATVVEIDAKSRMVKLACVCEVDGEACLHADAEVMVRKRRKTAA
jgi:3-hydroxybutyryl-CoA dehydratase